MAIPSGPGPVDLPTWAPALYNVADYVPHRTLAEDVATNTAGEDVYRLTFDSTTRPTGDAVTRLIADGVSWVTGRVTPLNTLSEGTARVLTTLYTAAAIERGWPADDSSLERARDLEKRMDLLMADLIASNNAANETGDFGLDIGVPYWSFPPADVRYDDSTCW